MTTAIPVNGPMMGFNAYPTGTELKICCNEYRRNESNYAERKLTMSTVAIPQTTTTWNIDPVHSVAEFKVKHMMISNVKGFAIANGTLSLDEGDLTHSRVEAPLDAASVNARDPHLKSADFFDVEKFPTLSFKF